MRSSSHLSNYGFNSRTLGRVRLYISGYSQALQGFNSRTLGRVRLWCRLLTNCYTKFQFTHPGKGATQIVATPNLSHSLFQFTHPGKGATRTQPHIDIEVRVSIHAPWEGCDDNLTNVVTDTHVSIHAPWEGCDARDELTKKRDIEFQFTHPGKGATARRRPRRRGGYVSIHAPWEGCDAPSRS